MINLVMIAFFVFKVSRKFQGLIEAGRHLKVIIRIIKGGNRILAFDL
jgi:hypothetical protein